MEGLFAFPVLKVERPWNVERKHHMTHMACTQEKTSVATDDKQDLNRELGYSSKKDWDKNMTSINEMIWIQ